MFTNFLNQAKIPDQLPPGMQAVVEELKSLSDQTEVLHRAYNILSAKYHGCHFRTYLKLHEFFITDLKKIWAKHGFAHCTTLNFLLRVLLIKSGWFTEEDVKHKYTLVWYVSPHQYLQVRLGQQFVNVDIWNAAFGKGLGDYAHGFHN